MSYVTELVCDKCGATYPHDRPVLLCTRCSGLLDARYNYPAIKQALNVDMLRRRKSSVWRWREFLPVEDELFQVDIGAGGSPLINCPSLAEWVGVTGLFVKYEGMQPTGSLKDRSFAVAVGKAAELGVRGAITYSSGNAGASLAAHASHIGMNGLILVNAWADQAKLDMLRAYGLPVILLNWSQFGAVEALMLHAIQDLKLFAFVNFQNPWRHEGSKTCAYEIWWDLEQSIPDHEIHPIGTGGGIFGAWKGYRELVEVGLSERIPRLHGTQPAACQSLVTAFKHGWDAAKAEGDPRATIAEAIANDLPLDAGRRPLHAMYETGGSAVAVPDAEMLDGIRRLGHAGIYAEPAGATTIWAAKQLAETGTIRPHETVVCVVTASGLKQPVMSEKAGDVPFQEIEATPDALDRIVALHRI